MRCLSQCTMKLLNPATVRIMRSSKNTVPTETVRRLTHTNRTTVTFFLDLCGLINLFKKSTLKKYGGSMSPCPPMDLRPWAYLLYRWSLWVQLVRGRVYQNQRRWQVAIQPAGLYTCGSEKRTLDVPSQLWQCETIYKRSFHHKIPVR